jgi:hypothetical protein
MEEMPTELGRIATGSLRQERRCVHTRACTPLVLNLAQKKTVTAPERNNDRLSAGKGCHWSGLQNLIQQRFSIGSRFRGQEMAKWIIIRPLPITIATFCRDGDADKFPRDNMLCHIMLDPRTASCRKKIVGAMLLKKDAWCFDIRNLSGLPRNI